MILYIIIAEYKFLTFVIIIHFVIVHFVKKSKISIFHLSSYKNNLGGPKTLVSIITILTVAVATVATTAAHTLSHSKVSLLNSTFFFPAIPKC